ncbi:uncharacterized protein G2W53_032642 [Senna tora]|uniref:RNase H type-1 domain-containing protein n=1 Tax=Senna tora TaxID=362788 RepID=A0A834SZI6_9FABA|nr:uncharacterized protein G2W53_032642 [Senna tora]
MLVCVWAPGLVSMSVAELEAEAVLMGLEFARDLGVLKLIVEGDSEWVMSLINQEGLPYHKQGKGRDETDEEENFVSLDLFKYYANIFEDDYRPERNSLQFFLGWQERMKRVMTMKRNKGYVTTLDIC